MSTSVSSLSGNFFPSAQNGFTTTLASTISSGAATVPLNSVAGYSNSEIAVMVVDPTDVTKKQTFTGIVDTSGVQLTSVVWTAGTNQTHSGGSTVVDYATATHISMMTKGILIAHEQTGVHKSGATYASPAFSGTATGSLTGLTMLAPVIETWDGWQTGSGAWTYASATTFTAPAADAAVMTSGDKIKLTQTTAKYFYVVSVSGTTITVTGGTDYTLANAAITLPFYSKQATPFGFPQNFTWLPTWANLTIGNAVQDCKFSISGGKVFYRIHVLGGTTSSAGTGPTFSFPVTSIATPAITMWIGAGNYISKPLWATWASTTTALLRSWDANNDLQNVTATLPATFGNNTAIDLEGWYEIP